MAFCFLCFLLLSFSASHTLKAVFGSRKSISGKYSIFQKCYFPERKMFLCVWLYFKKFSEKYFLVFGKCYKEKDKTRKTNTAPRLTLDARLGSTMRCFASSDLTTAPLIAISRSTAPLCEIAIDGAILRSVDRDQRKGEIAINGAISRSTTPIAIGVKASLRSRIAIDGAGACERRGLVMLLPLVLSLSLSLSLSLWNSFEVKIGTEIHFRSQSLFFFWSTEINFRKILFSGPTKHPHFRKSISPKTNTALVENLVHKVQSP